MCYKTIYVSVSWQTILNAPFSTYAQIHVYGSAYT